ncbi:g-protein coupled receptor 98 [Caerostris extrusa]|uniref:G-protein coupled receptor 98 n=1 Tax=Caerostris extrusa TaxID=172846 RepID=A0AAV4XA31_CAEEX|nr:g-protein coupled receptor 98 [Caerostris extrusa]
MVRSRAQDCHTRYGLCAVQRKADLPGRRDQEEYSIPDHRRPHSGALESFELELLDPSSGPGVLNFRGLGPRTTALITIADDDISPGILILEKPSYTVREADGKIQIGVSRVDGSQGRVRVQYQTVPLTAIPGSDFVPVSGELVFEDGVTRRVIDIQILNDQRREATEDFEVQIFNPVADGQLINFRGLGSTSLAVVSILDDDNRGAGDGGRSTDGTGRRGLHSADSGTNRVGQWSSHSSFFTLRMTLLLEVPISRLSVAPSTSMRGVKRRTISLGIVDDSLREAFESFLVEVYPEDDPTNKSTAFVTILDNDSEYPRTFSQNIEALWFLRP